MEVSINEQEHEDSYNGGVDNDDESRDGGYKWFKLDEPLDTGTGTESVEGDLPVLKSGQLARMSEPIQEPPPLTVHEKEKGESSGTEAVQFEYHFPEEVWLLILNKVEDEDRVNCCRAFPYLDRILTTSKPLFLSEQVLPLMDKWLSRNELLNCRRVCSKWCVGVDQLMYSEHAPTLESEFLYNFSNQEEVDRFIEKFSGHTRNPFIDGTVCIENDDDDEEYPEKALQLLRQFGKHIRIIETRWLWYVLDPLEWYRFFQEALRNTPNLRRLKIEELEEEEAGIPGMLELYRYMIRNPMPFIPSLDVLELKLYGFITETIQDIHNMLMLPYASQLKTFSINMSNWKDHYAAGLVNLSQFEISCLDSDANLERLLQLTAPIKQLQFRVTGRVSVPVLLRVLKSFPLLEDVSINFCGTAAELINGEDVSNLSDVNVPAIKDLKITNCGTLSYNFLQMFTGLRRLTVQIYYAMDIKEGASMEREKNLQLFKIVEDDEIYDSNIWKLIPTLKNAEIHHFHPTERRNVTHCGTREGYNEYLSSNKN